MNREYTQTAKRSLMWDNIKGLLIFLVVLGHMCWDFSFVRIIYVFHMPAFVFVSGLFTSRVLGSDDKVPFNTKAIRKYFLAFLLLNCSLIIYDAIIGVMVNPLHPIYTAWYLLALIVWRLLAMIIRFNRKHLAISIVVALLIGFIPAFDNTLAIGRIIAFAPFFVLGYILDVSDIEKLRKSFKTSSERITSGVVLVVIGVSVAFYMAWEMGLTLSQTLMDSYINLFDVIMRLLIFIVAAVIILGFVLVTPDKDIKFFTKAGKSSFAVFVFHRIPVCLIVSALVTLCGQNSIKSILISIPVSFLLTYVFSLDVFTKALNKLCLSDENNGIVAPVCLASLVVVSGCFLLGANSINYIGLGSGDEDPEIEALTVVNDKTPTLTRKEQDKFDNSYRIIFSGDLILLEDQVKLGYKDGEYDFDDMFEYTQPYIENADLAIGVFEGPMAGEAAGYTTSNYGDNKPLYLNFPDSFAETVKKSGFDLVTLANNHMYDKGTDGAMRTMDILDDIGLDYVGCYRNESDKANNSVRFIEKNGLTFAVLSYTYGYNYQTEDESWEKNPYMSSFLVSSESSRFDECKNIVKKDFEKAKSMNADFILVLPHMGTQFLDKPDDFQTTWVEIFKEFGADIILCDHTHSVQPVVFESYNDRDVFTAYCPGNYANIYRDHNGDASMLVEVCIDRESKTIIGGDIIPMWTTASLNGNYRPLPIYSIMTDMELRNTLTVDDLIKAREAHDHIVNVVLGVQMDITAIRDRYYFTQDGFIRQESDALIITDEMKDGIFYKELMNVQDVCFIGDSITCGSNNWGYSWYEPLKNLVKGKISELAVGGITTKGIIDLMKESSICNADLYVIAIGTNDVRYRNDETCAMDDVSYIENINMITDIIRGVNPQARIIFIAPWISFDGDQFAQCSYEDVVTLNKEYTDALKDYCMENGYSFINPNPYINSVISTTSQKDYLVDWIHPNPIEGIFLYSRAVMLYK